jgi:hypothetical protein
VRNALLGDLVAAAGSASLGDLVASGRPSGLLRLYDESSWTLDWGATDPDAAAFLALGREMRTIIDTGLVAFLTEEAAGARRTPRSSSAAWRRA